MQLITFRQLGTNIGARKRVKHPNIKKHTLPITTQKSLATTSRLAPSSLLAIANYNGSPSIGWRAGSTLTSLHTSLNRLAVKSLTSLRRMDGNPL